MPSDIMLTGMRMCCAKYTVHYERKLYLLSAIEASVIPPAEAPRRTTRVRAVSLGPGSCGTGEFMAQLGVTVALSLCRRHALTTKTPDCFGAAAARGLLQSRPTHRRGSSNRSQTTHEQAHIASALVFELSKVEHLHIREAMVGHLRHIQEDLAQRVARGLGLEKMPDAPVAAAPVL